MTTTRKPLPPMARIRQSFTRPRVDDAAAEMTAQMELLAPRIKAGSSVGITVGSRGIQNICAMLEAAIAVVRRCGATPVLLSAMGSHGGGTPEGQKEVLDSLNITEERLGAKVVTCATCRSIGQTADGLTAHMLDSAFSVDAIIPINRVKTHTSFKGCVESGMCKMLVVGLGGPGGAGQFHSLGQSELPRLLVDVSRIILQKMPVIGVMEVPWEKVSRYGIIDGDEVTPGVFRVKSMVEKPAREDAPSRMAIVGRYVLTPDIFDYLEKVTPGHGGEIQLTDALQALAQDKGMMAVRMSGMRFDAGDWAEFLTANIYFALQDEELRYDLLNLLKNFVQFH